MPHHIRFLLRHALFGMLAALVFSGLLLWFNVANLTHLVTHSDGGWLALGVMTVLFAITFASVQMGVAVMGLQDKDDGSDDAGPSGEMSQLISAPVAVPVRGPETGPLRRNHRDRG